MVGVVISLDFVLGTHVAPSCLSIIEAGAVNYGEGSDTERLIQVAAGVMCDNSEEGGLVRPVDIDLSPLRDGFYPSFLGPHKSFT